MTSAESSCSVCGGELEPHTRAECHVCGRLYHLNSRIDLPGADCGDVSLSQTALGLFYSCNTCLAGRAGEADTLDDVVTLDEAAAISGIAAEVLTEAANAGRLRRREAGPVSLFRRADIEAFAGAAHRP